MRMKCCSRQVAEYSSDFILSIIVGDDLVGRLGIRLAFDFKIKILNVLKNCDVAKV